MPLVNRRDALRPVRVTPLYGAMYRVEGPMPLDEQWAYPPGTLVEIHWQRFPDGKHRLVPRGPIPTVRSQFSDYYKRLAGMTLGVLPYLALMDWMVPRSPEGPPEPLPFLTLCVALVILSSALLAFLKPRFLIAKWALWSACGFGGVFGLISFFRVI